MKLFLTTCILVASSAGADSATQSEWSGGPGVPGPVSSWGSTFSTATSVDWLGIPGQMSLEVRLEIALSKESWSVVRSADIDGDGRNDVVGASGVLAISWWRNVDDSGQTWVEIPIDDDFLNPHDICISDINGDGNLDVAATLSVGSMIVWWENLDGTGIVWIEHWVDTYFSGAHAVSCADLDGDGDQDIIAGSATPNLVWYENTDGFGRSWVEHPLNPSVGGIVSLATVDVDSDGFVDVLAAVDASPDRLVWWRNVEGTGTVWALYTIRASFSGACSIHPYDIDGDGDFDVAAAGWFANSIIWVENLNGLGTQWLNHDVDPAFERAACVRAGDLDADGDIDLVGAAEDAFEVSWWERLEGPGEAWAKHVVDDGLVNATSVCAAQLDSDAHLEVVGAGATGAYWWDPCACVWHGSLESSILNADCIPDWGTLLWSSQTPTGTAVGFQVRSSDDPSSMGTWSDTLWAPCSLQGILADGSSFVQYRAILMTTDPDAIPTLTDVTLTWNPLEIGEGELPGTFELLPVAPNPSADALEIEFGLPSPGCVELSVFDISGRMVHCTGTAEYQPGLHTVQLGELSPGVYFVQMRAGEYEATERFVVIE